MRRCLIVAVVAVLAAAVPVSVSASEGERAPSWTAIVSQWVERVIAAVGGPPEDPGPPPEVPPVPPVPPEHSNSGGGGESGPEMDPNG